MSEDYRFIIEKQDDGDSRILNTSYVGLIDLNFERESGEEFVRVFPSGDVEICDKDDFNWIMEYENDPLIRCAKFLFHIELRCENEFKRYKSFQFNLNRSKPCLDTCTIKINLKIDDFWQCLKDGDRDRNVLQTGDLVEKTIDAYPDFNNLEFYITVSTNGTCNNTSSPPPVDTSSWGLFGCSSATIGSAGSGCPPLFAKVWARKVIKATCVAGSPATLPVGAILISDDCALDGTYTFAQPFTGSVGTYVFGNTSGSGQPFIYSAHVDLGHVCEDDPIITDPYLFVNDTVITTACQQPNPYPPINESIKHCFYVDLVALETQTPKTTYDRGRCLLDVLLWLAKEGCSGITDVKSLFMNKNVNDLGAVNYVTGANNKIDDLILLEKSDTVTPNSSEKATILNLNFFDFYEYLKGLINVRIDIDDNGVLCLEHISRIKSDKNVGLDLTLINALEGYCCYEYEIGSIPSREDWKFQDGSGLDFIGEPILYNLEDNSINPCVTSDDLSINLTDLTTDLEHIQQSDPDDQSLDGFVILAGEDDGNGGRKVISEEGELTKTNILNGHMAISNLQDNYFCHERKLPIGFLNKNFITFCSETKKKKGMEFSIKMCCEDLFNFDPDELIKTKFGNGELISGTYSLVDKELKLNLIY